MRRSAATMANPFESIVKGTKHHAAFPRDNTIERVMVENAQLLRAVKSA